MLWTKSTGEARVSLSVGIHGCHIDLTRLRGLAQTRSRRELVWLIEDRQEGLIKLICSSRYSRGYTYRRGGSYRKRVVTSLGEIRFKVRKVIRRLDGGMYSPILEAFEGVEIPYNTNRIERLMGEVSKRCS